jgi:uncharacterized protein YecE (DUF72 family)
MVRPFLRIGTSGWHYKHWIGRFYPAGMPSSEYLNFYLKHYDTVELNGVFYRLPKPEAVKHWYEQTPKGFLFSYKASRYVTHMKRLLDPQDALKLMFKRADLLKEKLGPILFQLPPSFKANVDRLRAFLKYLPRGYEYVMEYRNPSWFQPDVYAEMEKREVSLCLYNMKGVDSPEVFTGPLVYVRMHGSEPKYAGNYTPNELKSLAEQVRRWQKKRKVFVYFNNDPEGHALQNADALKSMLGVS